MLVRPLACLIGLGFVVLSGCSAEQSGMSDSGASIDAAAVDAAAGVDASVRDAAARDAPHDGINLSVEIRPFGVHHG